MDGVKFETLDGTEGNACAIDFFEKPLRCQGTFHNGQKCGIVRVEWANGTVEEGTWNMGQRFGLRRLIRDAQTRVEVWHNDAIIFGTEFGYNFVETYSLRSNDALSLSTEDEGLNLYPYRFSKVRNDQAMLDAMLQSRPVGASFELTAMWSRSYPLVSVFF